MLLYVRHVRLNSDIEQLVKMKGNNYAGWERYGKQYSANIAFWNLSVYPSACAGCSARLAPGPAPAHTHPAPCTLPCTLHPAPCTAGTLTRAPTHPL